jgi:hypothetical protein
MGKEPGGHIMGSGNTRKKPRNTRKESGNTCKEPRNTCKELGNICKMSGNSTGETQFAKKLNKIMFYRNNRW